MDDQQHQQAAAALEHKAVLTQTGTHYLLALGSTIIIYVICLTYLPQYLPYPDYTTPILTYLAAMLWFVAIEASLQSNLPYALAYIMGRKDPDRKKPSMSRKIMAHFAIAMAIMQILATATLSFASTSNLSDGLAERTDRSQEQAVVTSITSSYDATLQTMNNQVDAAAANDKAKIDQATATAKERVSKAKQAAQQRLSSAMDRLGLEMRDLAESGNDWATKQLQPYTAPAKEWGQDHISAAEDWADQHISHANSKQSAPTLRAELSQFVSQHTAAKDTVATHYSGLLVGDETTYQSELNRYWWVLLSMTLFALVLHVAATTLVVACRLERKGPLVDTGLGPIGALFGRFGGWMRKLTAWIAGNPDTVGAATHIHGITVSTLAVMPTITSTAKATHTTAASTPTVGGLSGKASTAKATHTTAASTPTVGKPVGGAVASTAGSRRRPISSPTAAVLYNEHVRTLDTRLRTQWGRYHQYKIQAAKEGNPNKAAAKLGHSENNLSWYQQTLTELEGHGIRYEQDGSKTNKFGAPKLTACGIN